MARKWLNEKALSRGFTNPTKKMAQRSITDFLLCHKFGRAKPDAKVSGREPEGPEKYLPLDALARWRRTFSTNPPPPSVANPEDPELAADGPHDLHEEFEFIFPEDVTPEITLHPERPASPGLEELREGVRQVLITPQAATAAELRDKTP